MARKTMSLKRKDTRVPGSLMDTNEGHISSFMGSFNKGPLQHYIEVELESDWFTLTQAKRLARILDQHIERVELDKGAGFTSGSRRKIREKGAPKEPRNSFLGYGDRAMDRFLHEVEKLADSHFTNWEHRYKWKCFKGHKSKILLAFDAWRDSVEVCPPGETKE